MSIFPSGANSQSSVQRAMCLGCAPGVCNQPLTSHCFILCFKDASGPIYCIGMQPPKLADKDVLSYWRQWDQYWCEWKSRRQVCNPRIHANNFSHTEVGFNQYKVWHRQLSPKKVWHPFAYKLLAPPKDEETEYDSLSPFLFCVLPVHTTQFIWQLSANYSSFCLVFSALCVRIQSHPVTEIRLPVGNIQEKSEESMSSLINCLLKLPQSIWAL